MPFQKPSAASALLLIILALASITGCGDGDQVDQPSSNYCGGNSADDNTRTNGLSISVGQLHTSGRIIFQNSVMGVTSTETIELANVGSGPLYITSAELSEERGGALDGHRELFRGESDWIDKPVALEPGETYELSVQYKPVNRGIDRGTLTLTTRCASQANHEVSVEGPAVEPDFYAPSPINFGRLPPRDDPSWQGEHRLLEVVNLGGAPLSIDDIYTTGSDRFRVSFPQPTADEVDREVLPDPANDLEQGPETLAPGEERWVRVWFSPDDNLPETRQLVFETDDADQPRYSVELAANSGAPCISVHPEEEIRFGSVPVDQERRKTVTIENCSRAEPLEISEVELSDDASGAFTLARGNLLGLPVEIPPGERANVHVGLQTDRRGVLSGELRIVSNDAVYPELRVPISASVTSRCPVAKARAKVVGNTRWQTTIYSAPSTSVLLDGSQSFDPDGHIARFEWTMLSRPERSTQRLLPDSSAESPRLFLDRLGTYEVELNVFDDEGVANCGERAIITVVAGVGDSLHIQLTWSTPADIDETDTVGTNLDLHYLHPNGHWNEPPWDIFWQNPNEDWNSQASSSDDPSLDIDRTDGAGPENISHSGLENLTYRTGVYYNEDNGFGASYATVRVFLHGSLALELENKYLAHEGKFWDVATIDWSNQTVSEVDVVYDGFPAP
jgi:hypothetical protein